MSDVAWDRGGEATIVASDGVFVTVSSTVSSAPGSTLAGRLGEVAIALKVRSCKREGERFRIDGRLVNLTREARAAIEAVIATKA